jgi:histidyl-tRNA synthetase
LAAAEKMLTIEINSATDNPLIFVDEQKVLSGGNFHGQPIGVMVDGLKIPFAELGAMSERRIARLADHNLSNGLPAMLCPRPGLNSGYMIAPYTAACLALDNQHLGQSDVLHSLPTCENQEDHNSNAMNATLNLQRLITNLRKILAIEVLCAVRGIELRLSDPVYQGKRLGAWTGRVYSSIIGSLRPNKKDHSIDCEITAIERLLDERFVRESDLEDTVEAKSKRTVAIPKGFRDYHPHEMVLRKEIFAQVESIFKLHNGVAIETPVLELKDVLFGKYGDQGKLVFDLEDQNGAMLSMRYDLTVPFARYMAMHGLSKMKRYQMGQVYRRDAPNVSKGRYRAFNQLDFDIAGENDCMTADSEVICIMSEILDLFLKGQYTIKFNHKALLDLILEVCEVPAGKLTTVCSSIDKLDKEPWAKVARELEDKGLTQQMVETLGQHIVTENLGAGCSQQNNCRQVLGLLRVKYGVGEFADVARAERFTKIFDDLDVLFTFLEAFDCIDRLTFDLSLARGLNYYTGVIFEAILIDNEIGVGSLAAGGAYSGLIGMFSPKPIPSVGMSIGIERLFTIMETRNKNAEHKSQTKVFVSYIGGGMLVESLKICKTLWNNQIVAEFPYKKQQMKTQIENVLKQGIPFMVLVGETEFLQGKVRVKNIVANVQEDVLMGDLIDYLKQRL